jgi:hypothetical protein
MSGWRPISSAPLDGRRVDLWLVSDFVPKGWRATNCVWVEYDDPSFSYCGWINATDRMREDGFLTSNITRATHWRPVPRAPRKPKS